MAVEFKNFDFSPFLDVKYSKATKGGALADAFEAVGQTLDAHGQNADEKLLSELSQEQDRSKVKAEAFYNPLNALNAEKIVDKNVDRYNAMDAKAREDSQYYRNEFTNQAAGDALSLSKDEWNAKYANAGGLDGVRLNNIFNQKEDRTYLTGKREQDAIDKKEANKRAVKQHNLNMQRTRNQMNRNSENHTYNKKQREQKRIDDIFVSSFTNGLIPAEEMETYKATVSPEIYGGIIRRKNMNDRVNKYGTLEEYKKSEEYKTDSLTTKQDMFKSKIYDAPKSTYQDKLANDYIGYVEDLSNIVGSNDLSNYDYDEAVKNKKLTPNELASYSFKLAKAPGSKEIDKKMITGDFSVINQKSKSFSKAFNNPKLDTGVFENLIQQTKAYLPDVSIAKEDLDNAQFRSTFSGFAATLLKIQSGATVTDKERAVFYDSLGSLSKNKKINAVGVLDKLQEARARFGAVKSTSPEYFNIKYGKGLRNLDKSMSEIESFISNDNSKTKTKVIGNDIHKKSKPSTTNQNISIDEAKNYGITFN